uniref:MATE family efflux transporter n=1 Tax=Ningiella ruwaisensis TaxID=2364274 RepID=UPI00109FC067|nr:MATE family efflux transporter [Ningiella ruwaisensis]
MAKSDRDLTQGSIYQSIANLTLPMVAGIVAVFSVSIVDTYFVGKLGTNELAALSFTFPVTMAIASLASGLGAGAASVVSRSVGAKDRSTAKRRSTDSLILATLIVLVISLAGFFSIEPLFGLLGAKGEVLQLLTRYMQIWYISMPFLVIPMVANAVIRSVGDAFWPSLIMIGAAVVNVAATPLLIFGYGPIPSLGIEGAAYGTLVARILTFIFALYLAYFREQLIVIALPPIQELMASIKEVLKIALPAGAGSVVNPIGIAVVTSILASYGDATVAAFGVATRIESFACIPMLALSAAIGPIAGQNWGAGNRGRVLEALKKCYLICFVWALLLAVIFYFAALPIANALASSEKVGEEAYRYLSVVTLSLFGYGIVIVSSAAFNSLGHSVTGLAYYLIRTAMLYVPLSFFASLYFDSQAIYYAIAASNLLAGVIVASFCLWWLNKAKKEDCVPQLFSEDIV